LPSDLRPATHEYMHLVMRAHFRSRDKDGAHTSHHLIRNIRYLHVACKLRAYVL